MIAVVLDFYFEQHAKALPSNYQAFHAIAVINEYLGEKLVPTAVVSTFGPIEQKRLMEWLKGREYSAGAIARILSVLSAAFRFAKRLRIVRDGFGNEMELQLLDAAPDVVTQAKRVAELTALPDSTPREWLPTFEQLGAFIDAIDKRQENLFRFVILALNTWARPEAIIDLRVSRQVNRQFGTLDLNPPGRRQTDKYRPKIRLTDNLAGWLDHWETDAPLTWNGQAVTTMKKTFKRHAVDQKLDHFTQDTIRHFMATHVRRAKPPVSQEQRDAWLGHDKRRTANWYEHNDPEFLADAKVATDSILATLQKFTARPLFACKLRASASLKVIRGGKAG